MSEPRIVQLPKLNAHICIECLLSTGLCPECEAHKPIVHILNTLLIRCRDRRWGQYHVMRIMKKKKKRENNGRGAQVALGAHGVRSGVQDAFREE